MDSKSLHTLTDKRNGTQNGAAQNGGTQNGGSQNGDLSKSSLLLDALQTNYKTFTESVIDMREDEYAIKWYDVVLALIVMTIGIVATVVATYSSWSNSIAYATFSPPCLMNATAAARSFLQIPMSI